MRERVEEPPSYLPIYRCTGEVMLDREGEPADIGKRGRETAECAIPGDAGDAFTEFWQPDAIPLADEYRPLRKILGHHMGFTMDVNRGIRVLHQGMGDWLLEDWFGMAKLGRGRYRTVHPIDWADHPYVRQCIC